MMFGVGEEPRHRVAHLVRLRELQDETRGFTAFICWPFQPANTRLDRERHERAGLPARELRSRGSCSTTSRTCRPRG